MHRADDSNAKGSGYCNAVQAQRMLNTTLRRFFLSGEGSFACLHPDSKSEGGYKQVPVRTSVDTVYAALGIAQDLGAQRSAEMIQFVRDEIIVSGGTPPNDWCVSLAVHVQSGLI